VTVQDFPYFENYGDHIPLAHCRTMGKFLIRREPDEGELLNRVLQLQGICSPECNIGKEIIVPDLDSIPDRMKWQIASRLASTLPVFYDISFRREIGERYDEIERNVWIEIGQQARDLVKSYQLPVGNAEQIADALQVVQAVFFGPEFRGEKLVVNRERTTVVKTRCPFLLRELEIQQPTDLFFQKCMAFSISAVEAMNPEYTLRFVRSMCAGDKTCEAKILMKKAAEKEDRV
jgi:hypothetical protein